MNLDTRLRRHFAGQGPGSDFDARVLARIAGLARMANKSTGDPAAQRAVALAAYESTRHRLVRARQWSLLWIGVFGALAMLVVSTLVPLFGGWALAVVHLLARPMLPGISFGVLALLLPVAVWLVVHQPRMASRW